MPPGTFNANAGRVLQRTETTTVLKQLFAPLKIPEPPKYRLLSLKSRYFS